MMYFDDESDSVDVGDESMMTTMELM
jgi:hypothetical protein